MPKAVLNAGILRIEVLGISKCGNVHLPLRRHESALMHCNVQ